MTRPRRSMKSKPQLDAMEQRLVLSQATAAPVAQTIPHRPPAMVLLQQRISAQPQSQIQAQLRLQTLVDSQRGLQPNQGPEGPQAARAAQRETIRLQMEQRREQAKEQRELREQQNKAAANSDGAYKVNASSTDTGGFSFKKIWKSIFPW